MPPKKRKAISDLGDDPERVAEKRRLNREAAQRCRERRKQGYSQLKKDLLDYDCKNVAKQEEIRQLLKIKKELESILSNHQCVLQSVSPAGGSTNQPSAALGAPRATEAITPPGGQSQKITIPRSQGQQHHTLPRSQGQIPCPQGFQGQSREASAETLTREMNNNSTVTMITNPVTVAIVTDDADGLPEDIQSQLLSRFLVPQGQNLEDEQARAAVSQEDVHDVIEGQEDVGDVNDLLDDDDLDVRYETTVDLSAIGLSHVEHSYCNGGDNRRQPDEL